MINRACAILLKPFFRCYKYSPPSPPQKNKKTKTKQNWALVGWGVGGWGGGMSFQILAEKRDAHFREKVV